MSRGPLMRAAFYYMGYILMAFNTMHGSPKWFLDWRACSGVDDTLRHRRLPPTLLTLPCTLRSTVTPPPGKQIYHYYTDWVIDATEWSRFIFVMIWCQGGRALMAYQRHSITPHTPGHALHTPTAKAHAKHLSQMARTHLLPRHTHVLIPLLPRYRAANASPHWRNGCWMLLAHALSLSKFSMR